MATSGKDPTFAVNNFNEPKILSTKETYAKNLLTLLLGKPGFYPSQPTLGMDIGQYLYSFSSDTDTEKIKNELIRQCVDFMPEVEAGEIDVFFHTDSPGEFNNKPILVFKLPVVIDEKHLSMALGITINEKGELIYNFVEDKKQFL